MHLDISPFTTKVIGASGTPNSTNKSNGTSTSSEAIVDPSEDLPVEETGEEDEDLMRTEGGGSSPNRQ